jgi:hypothetical protein
MSFFERLKTAASVEWRAYTEHPFTNGLADGSLAEAAFRHYLVQDYLFLTEFARCVYRKPHPIVMPRWNRLSWRDDRAVPLCSMRPGLAIQVKVAA